MAITASIYNANGGYMATVYGSRGVLASPTYPTVEEATRWAIDAGAVDINDETRRAEHGHR